MTLLTAESSAPLRGIVYMVLGGALLTLNDAVVKWMTADFPVGQTLFLRGVFVFLPIALLVHRTGGLATLKVTNWKGQGTRAALVVFSTFMFITGLSLLPLADAIAIGFAGPIFLTVLAVPLLGEFVGWRRWSAVIVGFLGVLIMLRPGSDGLNWYALFPLGAALAGAFRDIITRRISGTESSVAIMLVTTSAVTLAGLASFPFTEWRMPSPRDLGLFALAGTVLGGAHYLMIDTFRHAEAGLVAPFKYSTMIWAVLFGFALWGDIPDRWIFIGSALVIGSGLYILHREARVSRSGQSQIWKGGTP